MQCNATQRNAIQFNSIQFNSIHLKNRTLPGSLASLPPCLPDCLPVRLPACLFPWPDGRKQESERNESRPVSHPPCSCFTQKQKIRAPIHFKPCTRKNSILCTEPYVGLHAKTAQKRHEGHFLFISQLVSNVNSIFVLSFLKKLGSSTSSVRPYPHAMLVLHKCSHLLISEVTIFCLSKPLYDPLDLRRQRVPLRL